MASGERDPHMRDPGDPTSAGWEAVFVRLKNINQELATFYDVRQENLSTRLPDEQYAREQDLLNEKGSVIVDLLSLRRSGRIPYDMSVRIVQPPDEILHPFSQNLVAITVPVPEEPVKAIVSKLKISQVRKPGIVDSTPEVLGLIGPNYTIEQDDPTYALDRSIREIIDVQNAEKKALHEGLPDEERFYLNRLKSHLIVDRLINLRLRDAIPEGYDIGIGFLSAELLSNKMAHLVEVTVFTPVAVRRFTLLRPRAYRNHSPELQEKMIRALDHIKGYDYYGYRRPHEDHE